MDPDLAAEMRGFMATVTKEINVLKEQVAALSPQKEAPTTPRDNADTNFLGLNTGNFGGGRGDRRRESIFDTQQIKMQTVPSFDKRFNVEAPVTLIKAWVFIREGHRYQDAYPTADFAHLTHISTKAKNFIVSRNLTLTEADFDHLTFAELSKVLLNTTKPRSTAEFLTSFKDLIKYEIGDSGDKPRSYLGPNDWQENFQITKLTTEKAEYIYEHLTEMVLHQSLIIPSCKPSSDAPGESMIEAVESLLSASYLKILKTGRAKEFTDKKWNFIDYVRLIQRANHQVFSDMEKSIPWLLVANKANRGIFKHEERVDKIKMQMGKGLVQFNRSTGGKLQNITDELATDGTFDVSHNGNLYAGGLPYDADQQVREELMAETQELIDRHESTEEDELILESLDPRLSEAQQEAVNAVRFEIGEKRPVRVLRPDAKTPSLCWHYIFSKGAGCPRGDDCQNSHDANKIREALAGVTAFWQQHK